MRKGQQNFKIVVSDIDRGKLLEVVDGHSQEKLTEALMTQPLHWREQVEEVSVDMWGGFPKVIAQVFPNTRIRPISCYEKVNDALNKLRILLGITDRNSKYLLSVILKIYLKATTRARAGVKRISLYPNCL